MKQILITGGAGFIGSHLCARLLEEGNEVICLDNYFTGSKENVIPLLKNPHFELIRHDVSIPFQAEVDEIYNLACPASPVYYQIDPIQTIKTSVLGAVNMLGLAKRVNAKILQASTSEVYGDPMIHPQPESYWGNVNPIGPRSCYDEGKRCLVENDDPTAFGAGAIQFEVRENVEKFDFYKDDFENYQDMEGRVIGGISFRGRTYRNIG